MTNRLPTQRVYLALAFCLVSVLVLASTAAQAKSVLAKRSDDYYFPENVDQEEADRLIAEKKAKEKAEAEERARLETTEKPPEFFKLEETDFSQLINKEMAAEMLKKFQKEQMEKQKSKNKSDINHQMWSIITLALFFGTGIVVGILIVLVRGRRFQKSKKSLIDKKQASGQKNGSVAVDKPVKAKSSKKAKSGSKEVEKNQDEQAELKVYVEADDKRIVI